MENKLVTASAVCDTLRTLGVQAGDTILVHSSLRSLGPVDGGAAAVIAGLEQAIGRRGTLVMPTLCQIDFENSYRTWYMDKPSDVGYLTEFFRKQPYVYRSNHATHSVAARGPLAYYLTCEHGAYGPHLCPFGEYAFADSSPWMKLYHSDAKIIFIGVSTRFNTMKHLVEARYTESLLAAIPDADRREALRAQVATFGHFTGREIWPLYSGQQMHEEMERAGRIHHAFCGKAEILLVRLRSFCDACYEALAAEPERWCNEATMAWIKACQAAAASSAAQPLP